MLLLHARDDPVRVQQAVLLSLLLTYISAFLFVEEADDPQCSSLESLNVTMGTNSSAEYTLLQEQCEKLVL